MKTLDEYLDHSKPENVETLRRALQHFGSIERDPLLKAAFTYNNLRKVLGLRVEETAFSKFIHGTQKNIRPEDFEKLMTYLFDHGYIIGYPQRFLLDRIPELFFHASSQFLGQGNSSQHQIANLASGYYDVWRPSTKIKGHFVHGLMTIELVTGSHAIEAREYHRFQGGPKRGRKKAEDYFGYVLRKNKNYIILASDKTHTLRTTILNDVHPEDGAPIEDMRGAVFEVVGRKICCMPVVLQRIASEDGDLPPLREALIGQLDIVSPNDVPTDVMGWLEQTKLNPLLIEF